MTFTQIKNKRELALRVEAMMDKGEYPTTAVISALCTVVKQLCGVIEDAKHAQHEAEYKP